LFDFDFGRENDPQQFDFQVGHSFEFDVQNIDKLQIKDFAP
jgi:hypothetical protein